MTSVRPSIEGVVELNHTVEAREFIGSTGGLREAERE